MAKQARVITAPSDHASEPRARSLTEQVYDRIKDEILHVRWEPGEMLMEADLAARYGVSKTPVREALRLLLQDGWVIVLPRKGYLVRVVTLIDVREVFLLRTLIEPRLVVEFGGKATESDLGELTGALEAQIDAGDDVETALRAARKFHQIIAEGARMRRGRAIVTNLIDEVRRLHHLMPKVEDHIISAAELEQHKQIVEALRNGDTDAAADLMCEHINDVAEQMISAFGSLRR